MADERALLEDIALIAARQHHSRGLIGFAERREIAWGGVALAYCEGERDRGALIRAGLLAINAEVDALRHHHGLPDAGSRTGAKHAAYWLGSERTNASPWEDGLVERIAVTQVYYGLTTTDRDILLAEAWGTGHGYTESSWPGVLARARRRARRLWFDHEPAPGHYMAGRITRYRHRNGIRYDHRGDA